MAVVDLPTQFVYGVDEIYAFLAFGEGSLPIFIMGKDVMVDVGCLWVLGSQGDQAFLASPDSSFPGRLGFPPSQHPLCRNLVIVL